MYSCEFSNISIFLPTFREETLCDQMQAYTLRVNTRQNHSVILSKMCAIDHTMISLLVTPTCSEHYFDTRTVYLLLFCTMTNKFTINPYPANVENRVSS
jgi:hypothetical protein